MLNSPIYAITDSDLLPGERLFSAVHAALRGGIKTLQLRDKNATHAALMAIAKRLMPLCVAHQAQLIINDHVDIAHAVGAHGVHLGQQDGNVAKARAALGAEAIIGVTCHNDISLAQKAVNDGASYVAFGRFFPSATKPLADSADLTVLTQAKTQLLIPVVAIGGITFDNMQQIIEQGVDAVALCHELFAVADIEVQATRLLRHFYSSQKINK